MKSNNNCYFYTKCYQIRNLTPSNLIYMFFHIPLLLFGWRENMRRLEINCKYFYSLNGKGFFFSLLPSSTYSLLYISGLVFPLFFSFQCSLIQEAFLESRPSSVCFITQQALSGYPALQGINAVSLKLFVVELAQNLNLDLNLNQLYHLKSV